MGIKQRSQTKRRQKWIKRGTEARAKGKSIDYRRDADDNRDRRAFERDVFLVEQADL